MHAPWTACRPCVQRTNRPRGLAISILELNQAILPGPRARPDRGVGAHQSSPLQTAMEGGLHMADLNVNGKTHQVDVDPNTPLLWVLRDTIGLTGTKYGCGIAQCGACTVHVDGIAMRSCSVPLSAVAGRQITTIEGLAQNAALLKDKPKPSDADIDANITNICRCGTFQQVRAAIHAAAASA